MKILFTHLQVVASVKHTQTQYMHQSDIEVSVIYIFRTIISILEIINLGWKCQAPNCQKDTIKVVHAICGLYSKHSEVK